MSLAAFRTLAPEFAGISDDDVNDMLAIAYRHHTASAWGSAYADGMALYAAHLFAISQPGASSTGVAGLAGAITGRSAGDVSESYGAAFGAYAPASPGQAALGTTPYGRQYLYLVSTRAARAPYLVEVGT